VKGKKMSNGSEKPSRESQVSNQHKWLKELLNRLSGTVERLEKRLEPALIPRQPKQQVAQAEKTAEPICSMASGLSAIGDDLERQIHCIEDLIERLEI